MFSASWLVKPEGFTYQLTIICNTSSINTHAYSSLVKPDWFTYQLKIFVIPRGYTYQFIIFGNIQRIYSTVLPSSQFYVLYLTACIIRQYPKDRIPTYKFGITWRITYCLTRLFVIPEGFLLLPFYLHAIEKTIIFLMPFRGKSIPGVPFCKILVLPI